MSQALVDKLIKRQSGIKRIDRRNFLKISGLSSAALIIGVSCGPDKKRTIAVASPSPAFNITPYVIIDKSGKITLMNPKPDMGQGTFQSVPSLIAEELEVPLDGVTIVQTGGEKEFGGQTSGGSYSVRGNYQDLRKVGAAAKTMLIGAAAAQWKVPVSECYAENAKIIHRPSGKSLGYGELVEPASKLPVPQNPVLKDPKDFKILGKNYPRPDVPLKSSGRAIYGIDVEVPGMVYASIEHNPVFGGKLVSFDESAALKVPGVQKVVKIQRMLGKNKYDAVAVIAANYWAARQGRLALNAKWDNGELEKFNSKDYEQSLRDMAVKEGKVVHNDGDFNKSFAGAPVKVESFYETPVVSHSPMEPMNCVVQWTAPDAVEVWVSAQGPDLVKDELSKTLALPADKIKVHILFSGGGFGRRLYPDFATEAAHVAKEAGKPVKVVWTREDDTQLGPFRPLTFSAMKAGLTPDGKPVAFQHKVIGPSIESTMDEKKDETGESSDMTEGISTQKYELPNMRNEYVYTPIQVPLAAWRSVTSSTLAFAHECFIDEMAVKAGKDPMAYRLDVLLTKDSDCKKVLQKLKEVSGWDKPLPAGWGRGVAQYEFFAGLAGYVVVVSSQGSGVKIEKVYSVIDLGTVVNPNMTALQIEGAATMALTAAIKNGITFKNGQTEQTNFHNNPIVRINEMPPVEVHILADGGKEIKGVGEPGIPPFAPALANAIYAATGKRVRRMPFDLNKIA
ncbi:MAG TPA: molybdopterin cofactor-binding domain-containing protein [Puia sp.]|jgi:isoquinoline 1-oxidoreductase beta subunit|nr:molybdopterin cofactor-binding domain-containing protein [Puia sp.]